jgi:hypothetical protein
MKRGWCRCRSTRIVRLWACPRVPTRLICRKDRPPRVSAAAQGSRLQAVLERMDPAAGQKRRAGAMATVQSRRQPGTPALCRGRVRAAVQ